MQNYHLEITELAEEEYSDAFHYYENKQCGLGSKFEKEVEILIGKIKENPFLFQRRFKHYREAILKKFPFFLVYEIIADTVIIHSFFHANRNPKNKLKKRI